MSSNLPEPQTVVPPPSVKAFADLVFGEGNWEIKDQSLCTEDRSIPLIQGQIPVMLEQPIDYLTQTFIELEEAQQNLQDAAQELSLSHCSKERLKILQQMAKGYEHNAHILKAWQAQVRPFLNFDDLLKNINHQTRNPYLGDFTYLRRDWAGHEKGEQELATLLAPIRQEINSNLGDRDRALVLGAGCGRLAWELADSFEQVLAVDNSLTMAQQFLTATQDSLEFYGVFNKNIGISDHFAKTFTASLAQAGKGSKITQNHKVSYFIGDARNLPMPDQSVSLIVSAYFTDVLPIHEVLQEVKRLLRPGGLFIHFGPLEYHFPEVANRLSMEELQAAFVAEGFSLNAFSQHETLHLNSPQEITARFYNNWFVSFQKEEGKRAELKEKTILCIPKGLRYEVQGNISGEGEESKTDLILANGKRFEGADTVVDIIREVHSGRSAQEITEAVATSYGLSDEASKASIFAMLAQLLDQGILAVKP